MKSQLVIAILACSSLIAACGDDGSSTSGADASDESSDGSGDTTGTDATSDTGTTGGAGAQCDMWEQDCAEGYKCAAYANMMPWWDDWKCVPVVENPKQRGDTCTVEDHPASGLDDCDFGLFCFEADMETLQGTCFDMCAGDADSHACPDPSDVCVVANILPCLASCNPIVQDCGDAQACYPWENGDELAGFVCAQDDSLDGGGYGDGCEYVNVCDPGLFCADAELVPGCQDANGCCSEFCDLDDADPNMSCAGFDGGQECIPAFSDGGPPGTDNIGMCGIPQ